MSIDRTIAISIKRAKTLSTPKTANKVTKYFLFHLKNKENNAFKILFLLFE
jgi:hypothetical protein